MRLPRVLIAIPIVAAGILTPAWMGQPDPAPAGVIGMGHDSFVVDGVDAEDVDGRAPTITLHVGERLAFQNSSRWVHILGPGDDGHLSAQGDGSMEPLKLVQENGTYTTAAWTVPGTYQITCTVHPDMNATVVVLP